MALQLEIGKTYRNREDRLVKIVGLSAVHPNYPFKNEQGLTYTANGTWSILQGPTKEDLIEEVIDRKPCALFNGRRLRRLVF